MEKTTREGYLSSPNKYVQLKNKSAMKYIKIMKGCWMMNLAMMFLLIWCSIPLCRAENLQKPSIEFVEKNIVITSRTGRIVPCRKGEYCPMYTITADDWPIRIKCTENGQVSFHAELNVIKNCEIVQKLPLTLPKEIKDVLKCKNPLCITSIEQELPHIFVLTDESKEVYRCKYCEEKYSSSEF